MEKLKVVAVSYLNTKPFILGLQQPEIANQIELVLENPADCAQQLIEGKADIGLVPVAAIPSIKNATVFSDYCIGCDGEVSSVGIFSQVPIQEIHTLLLDYQSRTSVELAKVLCAKHWNISPLFKTAEIGYEKKIKGNVAGVIIGDRALQLKSKYKYYYDLGTAWKEHTGLPFVFACWVVNKPISEDFKKQFNEALKKGKDEIKKLRNKLSEVEMDYLQNRINYTFKKEQKEALNLFLGTV